MSYCHPKCHQTKNRVVSADNSTKTRDCSSDLLADYPTFAAVIEAFPEAFDAVTNADLPAELATERDVLLRATAALWERWNALGRAIATADKDITGAQSVVALFNAIGISATPLKGAGFRINSNTITEHEEARGLGQSLYQKLLSLKNGDIITPQQVKDYADIANQAREDQYVNLTNQVHNANLNADFVLPQGNGRQIDPSTARIFLRLTGADNQGRGGDTNKARAAAKAKGWRF